MFRKIKTITHQICLLGLLVTFFRPSASSPSATVEWKSEITDYDQLRQGFEQPPMWYAPHTFWFWDTPLDPQLAASMSKEMTTQRLNPGYAHPRHSGAADKPYPKLPLEQWLSPLWFESFGAALQEAENAGMTLGYCDEYWWPSGQAAGRVLEAHPELEAKSLNWTRQEITGPLTVQVPKSKFSVAAQLSENDLIIANTLSIIGAGASFSWNVPAGRWVIFSYNLYHHPGVDGGKVNYIDPQLMDVFIPIAHEPYEDNFGEKMGQTIPGVFVDNEGDYGWKMAWSEYLPKHYLEMKGRDIRLWMPLLTEQDDQGLWAKACYDWFDVVSDIYCNEFLARLSKWLEQRGMYCISNLWEETLMLQTRAVGDFMRAQRSVSLPGNDCLQMRSQHVHDFKETQSVCEFEDRPFMSEIMGVAGWEQTPVQMKMAINAITAWGVNHVVPHGINLNRKLETIPYPADWFTENPYWRYLHLWTDFARRAAFVNRQGRLVADILIINPLESVWALSDGYFNSEDGNQWDAKVIEINDTYSAAMDVLTRARLDYLIADRYYLEKALVELMSGQGHAPSKAQLRIGSHNFSAIVLPPMVIVSRITAQKILDFAKAGGTVVVLGDLPKGSPEKGAFDQEIVEKMEQLKALQSVVNLADGHKVELLPQTLLERIYSQLRMLSGDLPLLLSHRKIGKADFYWLANNENVEQSCTLYFKDGDGRAEIWDCETGTIHPIFYQKRADGCVVNIEFKPYKAFWLVFNPNESPVPDQEKKAVQIKEIKLTDTWHLSLPESKQVKVSFAKVSLSRNDEFVQKSLQADYDDSNWKWQDIVRPIKILDFWHASMLYIPDSYCKRFYRYTFNLADNPQKAFVNINADNSVRLWVNGSKVKPGLHANTWANVDLHTIGSYLQKGENLLAVEVTNNPGYGWLIVQGLVKMDTGDTFEILTNAEWKEAKSAAQGWQNFGFDDSAWESAQLASLELSDKEIKMMQRPQKVVTEKSSVWWRLRVPPAAKELILPGLSKQARIWIDGKQRTLEGKISLPKDSKVVAISTSTENKGLTAPAEFHCQGSSKGDTGSWLDMGLQRFTGFVDYEISFKVNQPSKEIKLDLGKVLYMAEVWINDRKVGERLWPPFTFEVTEFTHPGVNRLRIRVGNLMVNKMGLEDDIGQLRKWGWRGAPPIKDFDAGLFGPIRIWLEDLL